MTHDVERKGQKTKDKSDRKKFTKETSPGAMPETKKRKTLRDEIYHSAAESPPASVESDPDALDRFRLSHGVKSLLIAKGITSLFPIQTQTFDLVLDGFDVVGRAKTGSGKTLAFVLPIMERLMKENTNHSAGRGPSVLCLTPTRELAKQVETECAYIGKAGNVITCCIYGSHPYYEQERALRRGIDFLVGTPGRIKDHINRGNLTFSNLKFQILDECDQMLQMGFVEDVEFILNAVGSRGHIQTLLFSATLPPWVRGLLQKFCKPDYRTIDLMTHQSSQATNCVEHKCVMVDRFMEVSILPDLIQCYANGRRTIVFVDTKANCDKVAETLSASLQARAIHGDLQQKTRETTLAAFRSGEIDVLVATDVAARGLDIPEVGLVIQTTPPKDVESYVHRSGRTGRAERTGICICVISRSTEYLLRRIQNTGKIRFQQIQPPQMRDMIEGATKKADELMQGVKRHKIEMFREAAKKLLKKWEDPSELVAASLACITGYAKQQQRSLLLHLGEHVTLQWSCASERPITIEWAKKQIQEMGVSVELKGIRLLERSPGVVFDVHEDEVTGLLDAYKDSPDGCTMEIVTVMPRLQFIPRGPDAPMFREGRREMPNPSHWRQGNYGPRNGRASWNHARPRQDRQDRQDFMTTRPRGFRGRY